MAIKITKEPTIKRYKAKCPICGCEFEFDTTDANWYLNEVRPYDTWGGLSETTIKVDCRVSCPACNMCIENKQTEVK